jgi:hypothetical protein
MAGLELSFRSWSSENAGSASYVWLWHQSAELKNVKSDDAAAAATARWAGEAALRNATDTTTKDKTTTVAAAGARGAPLRDGARHDEARLRDESRLHDEARLRGESRLNDEARHGETRLPPVKSSCTTKRDCTAWRGCTTAGLYSPFAKAVSRRAAHRR